VLYPRAIRRVLLGELAHADGKAGVHGEHA